MEKTWWKEAVVYQIYPRSFMDGNGDGIGDLKGITSKLDYLKELGVDVIWLSPVYRSPNDDNGYDISDYCAIMEEFGTMGDFDEMLSGIHKRGMKLVMDLVVNHTSDEHAWFQESRKSKDNPYRDYYIWRKGTNGGPPNNWGSFFSGSAWQYDAPTEMYYLHLFSKKQPDLNWDNPKVRTEVFSMMDWWLRKGIDGFRMDVISLISKKPGLPDGIAPSGAFYADCGCANGPNVHAYLQEMNRKVLSRYDLMTVGECAGVTVEEAKRYASLDGRELNMVFQFEHVGLDDDIHGKWTDRRTDLKALKQTLSRWQTELSGKAWNSLYFGNHDQPRSLSRFGTDHKDYRTACAKMLATCLHMMQGTPYVYQGEELGMTNCPFERIEDVRDIESLNAYRELKEAGTFSKEEMMRFIRLRGRDNARTPMQWDKTKNAGFTQGKPWIMVNPNYTEINAAAQIKDPDSVFSYYKKLIALRKQMEIIVYGEYELLEADHDTLYVYTRSLNDEKLLVICNFSAQETPYTIPQEFCGGRVLVGNYGREERVQGEILLKPYEALAVLS